MERSSGAAPPRQSRANSAAAARNSALLKVRVESAGPNASVVALTGELDLSTIPAVAGRLFHQLRMQAGVVVDLTRLSFIDSSGIGLLIQAFRATDDGGKLHTVIAQSSQVERVFRLAGIDRSLPLFFERDAALAALNGGGAS